MKTMQTHLCSMGYEAISVDVPLTLKTMEDAYLVLEEKISKHISNKDIIHLVGHSTGGLLIRYFINHTKYLDHIGRCVLIATPNKGTELADQAMRYSRMFAKVFKTVESLHTESSDLTIKNINNIEIGAIAGNKCNLILGKLLHGENDGRVTVDSATYEGVKEFIVLDYGHKDIHHQYHTAEIVRNFLQTGKFYPDEKE